MDTRELILTKQNLSTQNQISLGVVHKVDIDEDGHPTGMYYVLDAGSGAVYKCYAIRYGNIKYVYSKGDQVIIALGVNPSNNVSCVILGQLAKEYPEKSIPPAPDALDEGEIGIINPISKAGVFVFSDGLTELKGRLSSSVDTVSLLLGGMGQIFSFVLNAGTKLIELTKEKGLYLFLNSIEVLLTSLLRVTVKSISIFVDKLFYVHSKDKILLVSEEGIATTTKKHEMYADEIKIGEDSKKQYHKVARADSTKSHIMNIYNKHDTDLLPKLAAFGIVINPITKTTEDIPSDTVEVD